MYFLIFGDKVLAGRASYSQTYVINALCMSLMFIVATNDIKAWVDGAAPILADIFSTIIFGFSLACMIRYEIYILGSVIAMNVGIFISAMALAHCSFCEIAVQNPIFLYLFVWAIGLFSLWGIGHD